LITNPHIMKGYLGEFEELVMLTIASLGDEAYGVGIKEEIEKRTDRSVSIGALHSTITRLEEKGFVKSWLGEPTQERAGEGNAFSNLRMTAKWPCTISSRCAISSGTFRKPHFQSPNEASHQATAPCRPFAGMVL
jgi:PadR family transcriptional regulator PadR